MIYLEAIYWKKRRLRFTSKNIGKSLNIKGCSPTRPPKEKEGLILNWGMTHYPWWGDDYNFINHPERVKFAVDKMACLQLLSDFGCPVVHHTSCKETVVDWLEQGRKVVARTLARSSKGRGIVLLENEEVNLVNAPLYTRYYGKTHEYRVHVAWGQVIDYIQKKRRKERDEATFSQQIRTFDNGWVFAHNDINRYGAIENTCIDAVKKLGLDFGAVDVLANVDKESGELKNFVICEINTAPGLTSPTTFGRYINAFA